MFSTTPSKTTVKSQQYIFSPQASEKTPMLVTPAQVRGAFTVMVLMGVPWIFGPLAFSDARVVFSYVFCICNSLQGFLIFVFRCLCNPEAKLAWIQLIKTGTFKSRRGPIKSYATDTASRSGDWQVTDRKEARATSNTAKSSLSPSLCRTGSVSQSEANRINGKTNLLNAVDLEENGVSGLDEVTHF